MQTYTPNRKRVEDTDIQETDVMNKLKLKSILEDILAVNEVMNLRQIEYELHRVYDFDRVESEGEDRLRFDYNNNRDSMWINDDGTVEGNVPRDNAVKRYIKKAKLKVVG